MQFARTKCNSPIPNDISLMSDGKDDEPIAPIEVGYRVATKSGEVAEARVFDALRRMI